MKKNEKSEEELMKQLSGPGLDKETLKQYSSHVARATGNIYLERIYWKGTPWPELLVAQTRLPINEIADLKNLINTGIRSVEMFPIGIINPEAIEVHINIPILNPVSHGAER